ncbi:FAD-dependent oxidoreductase [Aquimarina algiphila]|uniref:FAD-dependent oxidoreductase n=1 Tax=Aquimarina algiphila TaxID=2047982 RepID=UPI0023307B53|nr:FAD-dependent oxidoreductase [Aquimarina algiphila]
MNYNLIIIGGGPAGTGILFKAIKDGMFDILCDRGIAIIEKTFHLMIGKMADYQVNSDTRSDVFLECLEGNLQQILDLSQLNPEIEEIKSYNGVSIPLVLLRKYFMKLGDLLLEKVNKHPNCDVFLDSCSTKINQIDNGKFMVSFNSSKKRMIIEGKHVVVATGGTPSMKSDYYWDNGSKISLDRFLYKTIHSDTLIRGNLNKDLFKKLKDNPSVVILGGGHSGFSSADYLLNNFKSFNFSQQSIKIYSRSPARIYFESEIEALKHNYKDFDKDDFCKITKRLYRLAGLRMDGRKLYMRMLGMINNEKEERVVFKHKIENNKGLLKDINEATIIIQALGYSFNILPCYDEFENQISFIGEKTGRWVDNSCRLLNSNNEVVQNLYAYGLSSGIIPSEELGGEPSFKGQTNGLWYYQNILAQVILDQVLKRHYV